MRLFVCHPNLAFMVLRPWECLFAVRTAPAWACMDLRPWECLFAVRTAPAWACMDLRLWECLFAVRTAPAWACMGLHGPSPMGVFVCRLKRAWMGLLWSAHM